MNLFLRVIGAFFTSIAYALVLHAPKHTMIAAACNGAIAWLLFLVTKPILGMMVSMYFASVVMAIGSQYLARYYKTPVPVILIPSFIPFVPGGDIYRCLYYLLQDSANLSMHYLGNTLVVSGMIALGAMSVEACISMKFRK